MLRLFALFSILWGGLVSAAFAAEPKSNGFYIGGSFGSSEFEDDGLVDDVGRDLSVNLDLDDSDTAFGVMAGYKFFKYLAVEARYTDTGDFEVSGPGGASFDVETDILSIHAVGIIPFGASGWSIYGQLGVANVNFEIGSEDGDETAGSAGIGVSYNATENLAFALQVDAYAWEEDSFRDDYDLDISTAQLAVRYTF
jgi:opacity protein-like surface antigen